VTSNADRAHTLMRALRAGIEHDTSAVADLCTDDVQVWAPAWSASSATELASALERRDDAFTDVELDLAPLDVGHDFACAEWSVSMTHSGALELAGGMTVEPTGLRITLHGVTVAEFRGDRICSLRQYWDELSALEQLGVVGGGESSPRAG
jgi:ketosteroid isomerase-like protein